MGRRTTRHRRGQVADAAGKLRGHVGAVARRTRRRHHRDRNGEVLRRRRMHLPRSRREMRLTPNDFRRPGRVPIVSGGRLRAAKHVLRGRTRRDRARVFPQGRDVVRELPHAPAGVRQLEHPRPARHRSTHNRRGLRPPNSRLMPAHRLSGQIGAIHCRSAGRATTRGESRMIHTDVATLTPPGTHRRSPSRYGSDTYFLETCDTLERLSIDPDEFGCRTALLLLKPDAAVTGGMRRAVTWLTEHGYRIVGAHAVAVTHLHLRALWYFNWHCATPERRRLADQLAGLSASIVLVVTHPDDSVPASVRLTADKGPADPELSEVIAACAAGADASADAVRLADRIESGVERRSGDLAVTHDMVWQHLRAFGATARPRTGQEWVAAIDQADRHHVPVDPWFRIVLESAYLPMHRQTKQREL